MHAGKVGSFDQKLNTNTKPQEKINLILLIIEKLKKSIERQKKQCWSIRMNSVKAFSGWI